MEDAKQKALKIQKLQESKHNLKTSLKDLEDKYTVSSQRVELLEKQEAISTNQKAILEGRLIAGQIIHT